MDPRVEPAGDDGWDYSIDRSAPRRIQVNGRRSWQA